MSVLWTSLSAQFGVGAAVGVLTALFIWVNLLIAQRLAPRYQFEVVRGPFEQLDRYRQLLTPWVRWIRIGIAVFIGLSAGGAAGGAWQKVLLWMNRSEFGVTDPQFGRDVSYFVFQLPFIQTVLGWLWFAVVAAVFFSVASHVFHGSIRPQAGTRWLSPGALAHISVLFGFLALIKAGEYWFGRYMLSFSPRGVVTGASYTDVHAQLPALTVLTVISVLSALLFLVNIRLKRWALPIAAVMVWVFTAVVAGGIWPWWVQRFSVNPQELQRERPFIARNIEATRAGFGLEGVEARQFPASSSLTGEQLTANENLLNNVRLWDPDILKRANEQLQAIRSYYHFSDVDIDRYEVDGVPRQVLLAARELALESLDEGSKTWSNEHLQYTHGYGIVAGLANEATSSGQPNYLVRNVPGTVSAGAESLNVEQPALYYGENFDANEYSIVNTKQEELDYPTETGVQRSSYEGAGGIELNGILRKVAFAIREGEPNLILSGLIESDSRILIYRNVRDRVLRAAPFLSLDHDPYVTVVDGDLKWVLDGYTTTPWYPYSERLDLTQFVQGQEAGQLSGSVNYIRNSVKVVMDAYDGTMTFYIIDPDDPLIQAWSGVFPDLFTTEDPPAELEAHFRYPEDMFDVQSQVYLNYHMTDPDDFYAKEDGWQLPTDPTDPTGSSAVPGTYLLTELPGESTEEFVLMRPANPRGKDNMVGVMVGRSDPGHYGEFLSLLFPRQRQVSGPVQVDNLINQDVEVSQTITLLSQEGSTVEFGSLVLLPIDEAILYVQPIFVTAGDGGIPELKRVALVFGEEVAFAETFDEALAELFDLPAPGEEEPPPDEEEEEPTPPDETSTDIDKLIAEAARLYRLAQEALQDGDFEEYGRLIDRLGGILDRLERASQAQEGGGR